MKPQGPAKADEFGPVRAESIPAVRRGSDSPRAQADDIVQTHARITASTPNMLRRRLAALREAHAHDVFGRRGTDVRILKEAAMAEEAGRSRLGRGLASLIGDMGVETSTPTEQKRGQRRVPVEYLRANPRNPRQIFSEVELDELTASIKERGIIQPIVVRAVADTANAFEIIAGERRWRASQRAGLHDVPIVVLDVSDGEALELAIIENVQRADLNPLEEALGYQSLADQFSYQHDTIAKAVGKSRSHVANTMRLLKLPESVRSYINAGKLSAGHARALIGQDKAESLARDIVERGLNVRQVETLVRENNAPPKSGAKPRSSSVIVKDADTRAVEKRLSDALGLTVTISSGSGEAGALHVAYKTLDQLDEVIKRLEG